MNRLSTVARRTSVAQTTKRNPIQNEKSTVNRSNSIVSQTSFGQKNITGKKSEGAFKR